MFLDNFYMKIGRAITTHGGKHDKAIGGAEVVVGSAMLAASKTIYKAQGPIGHFISDKMPGRDPISGAIEDWESIIEDGKKRLDS